MRQLTEHKVNKANDLIVVNVIDAPGSGGASHVYEIVGPNRDFLYHIKFQNGPIAEAGINGLTHEVLLAILVDRMRAFQEGPYRCRENAIALTHMEDAQNWLNRRTLDRMTRGVEGKHAA